MATLRFDPPIAGQVVCRGLDAPRLLSSKKQPKDLQERVTELESKVAALESLIEEMNRLLNQTSRYLADHLGER